MAWKPMFTPVSNGAVHAKERLLTRLAGWGALIVCSQLAARLSPASAIRFSVT